MDGVFAVNKPEGFTSFDVIAKLRGILGQRRLGHSGTLDPMATGVLVVFAGTATKAVDLCPDDTKSYTARVQLGVSTDSGDRTGEVTARSDVRPTLAELNTAASRFIGEIQQIPPMVSAVKVNGQRLYDLARAGKTVERKPRTIYIDNIEIEDYDGDAFTMHVDCRRGTYIRTLAEDIAAACGTCGHLAALTRTASGGFTLDDCCTLEQLQAAKGSDALASFVRPVDQVFRSLPSVTLSDRPARLFLNGMTLDPARLGLSLAPGDTVRVYEGDVFLGLGRQGDAGFKKTVQFHWK